MMVAEKSASRLRVQVEFTPNGFDHLEEVREETGATSKQEVLRDALRVYEWLLEQAKKGHVLEVKDAEGALVGRIEAQWLLR